MNYLFDHYREIRHNDQHDLSFFSTQEEAEDVFGTASKFLKRMNYLLGSLIG